MGLSWHKVSAASKTGKLCTTHFISGNIFLSQRLTDPILADKVSRQFRAAYWLITTKLIHMSWSEILLSLVILSLFTFELHVIELFLPTCVLMIYIRQWPSWCNVNSGAAYWLTILVDGTLLTQSFSFLIDWEVMYHSLYMWKSFSEPTLYGPNIGWRGVTLVQGGILADYDQNFSRGWDSPDTKFQLHQRLGNYVPLTLYV